MQTTKLKTFSQGQVSPLSALYESTIAALQGQLRTMQATRSRLPQVQYCEAPDTGQLVVEEQQKRGLRP